MAYRYIVFFIYHFNVFFFVEPKNDICFFIEINNDFFI